MARLPLVALLACAACAGPRPAATVENQPPVEQPKPELPPPAFVFATGVTPSGHRALLELRVHPPADVRRAIDSAIVINGAPLYDPNAGPPEEPEPNASDHNFDPDPNGERPDAPDGLALYFDLDRDDRIDAVLVTNTFFGPSVGHEVFLRRGDKWSSAGGGPGTFLEPDHRGRRVVLRYLQAILDPSEPYFQVTWIYSTSDRSWRDGPAFIYATQTAPPGPMLSGRSERLATAVELRTNPGLTAPPVDDEMGAPTATIDGNVVARFAAGARAQVLAVRDGWRFVCLNAKPLALALVHNMEGEEHTDLRHYCGWITGK